MSLEWAPALILFLSAFTFGFSGFGFALVSVPLLALVMPIKTAVAFQFPYATILVLYHAWHYRRHVEHRELWPIVLGSALGMPIGLWLLYQAPEMLLKRALALFIVLAIAGTALPAGRRLARLHAGKAWWGALWGLVSGWFQGAYSTGGPPAVIYVMSLDPSPAKAMGFLGSYFSFLYLVMAGLYAASGLLSWPLLKTSALYAPVVLAGTVLGHLALGRMGGRAYRQGVNLLLVITAVLLWLRT
ncbi:MAG: sulfite exporter TauE/SafE family protein [Pseudomonadota bacterium]